MRTLRNMDASSFSALQKRMEDRKKKITSPPDGGSDFKKTDDDKTSPPDGGGDFAKNPKKDTTSPPDDGSDFAKKDANAGSDNVGDADMSKKKKDDDDDSSSKKDDKKSSGGDEPKDRQVPDTDNVVCDVVFLSSDDDDQDDDDDDNLDDQVNADIEADKKKKKRETSTEGLLGGTKKFFTTSSDSKSDWPKEFSEVEAMDKVIASVPEFVGPVGEEVAREKTEALEPTVFAELVGDIEKAGDCLSGVLKQVDAFSKDKTYDPKTAIAWGVKLLNSVGSPYFSAFAIVDEKRKLYGIGRHNLVAPEAKQDLVGRIGWTENLLNKNVAALKEGLVKFTEQFKKLYPAIEKVRKEVEAASKDAKYDKTKLYGLDTMGGMIVYAMATLCEISRMSFEACDGTLRSLAKVFPTKG